MTRMTHDGAQDYWVLAPESYSINSCVFTKNIIIIKKHFTTFEKPKIDFNKRIKNTNRDEVLYAGKFKIRDRIWEKITGYSD